MKPTILAIVLTALSSVLVPTEEFSPLSELDEHLRLAVEEWLQASPAQTAPIYEENS
jgi:hypothetical protein